MKKENITYQIHWLAFTVFASPDDAMTLYELFLEEFFGPLLELGHGGRGFSEIYHGLLQVKVYLTPVNISDETYWHIEIPGQACDAIPCEYFQALICYLEGNFKGKFKFTRLDFAFDHVDFTPQQVEQAIREDKIRSLAKRHTLVIHSSPFVACDNGDMGTYTVNFGSRSSERMIRVYNKRGFTRLEFEMSDKRADRVARELLSAVNHNNWFYIMVGHLRDYIDFETDWWQVFINGIARAKLTVSKPKEVSMQKLYAWIERQVSPSFSVLYDLMSENDFEKFMRHARARRNQRYETLLAEALSDASGGVVAPQAKGHPEHRCK